MGLEKITIENFKSYKGKHVIGPFYRFTCIVGPNGCGKSNIMDAISFALGINTQHLRSENVSSLANHESGGTTVRVALTFKDTSNYDIAREIRGSKTTYLINGMAVSYEDYRRFLESKNIFPKIRNFLVFQSDVGSIALKTPRELCRLFEEISGSIELKDEYEAALANRNKAIAECSYALELKKDMMEKVREMEKEQEQERNFKKLVARKEALQQKVVMNELYSKGEQMREVESMLERLERQLRLQDEEIARKQETVQKTKVEAAEAQKAFFRAERQLNDLRDVLSDMQNAILRREERRERMRWEADEKRQAAERVSARIEERRKEVSVLKSELEALGSGFRVLEREHEEKKRLFTEEVLEQFEKERALFDSVAGEECERLNELRLQYLPIKRKKESSLSLLAETARKLKHRREDLRDRRRAQEALEERIRRLKQDKEDFERRSGETGARYQAIIEEERVKNNELAQVMEKMVDAKIDHRESGKKMLIRNTVETLKALFSGVHGRVVDLVRPTQKKYEIPLSSLFGGYDQAVVVDDDAVAISAIEYIKERKLCRMTFLPLRSLKIQHREIHRNLENSRPAIDTVVFDEKFKSVAEFILKNSLIVDSTHRAKEIMYKEGLEVKICTLDGTIFHKNGFITGGGSRSKFESCGTEELLSRRSRLLRDLRDLQAAKAEFSDIEIVLERIKRIKEKIAEEERRLQEERGHAEIAADDVARHEETVRQCERDIDECNSSRILEEVRVLEESIARRERDIFGVFQRVNVRSLDEFRSLSSENHFEAKKLEYESLKTKIEARVRAIEGEIAALEEEKTSMVSACTEQSDQHAEDAATERRMAEIKDKIAECEKQIGALADDLEGKTARATELSKAVGGMVEEKEKVERQILQLTSTKERLGEDISEVIRFAYLEEINIPLTGRDMQLESLETLDGIDFSGFVREDLESLKREVSDVNREIDESIPHAKMSANRSINMAKITEDYERCKAAVISSREEFNYIKKKRSEMFMECFTKISGAIGPIYKELTQENDGEGNAFLILDNTAEPYNGGVQFHVMPPKKRFREIGLLSGGEKTMASLSLIFALHSFRPAPFYVFDELDSALDKGNVAKLVSFLANLQVQLLVITLKPQVFQHADALIGVYKDQEWNSSRVLSYRFE